MGTLHHAREAKGFSSNQALAEALLVRWDELAPTERKPKPASLATYVGNLARGDASWWESHMMASQALTEVLGTSPLQLGIDLAEQGTSRTYPFDGFPELEPFDLLVEDPLDLWYVKPTQRRDVAATRLVLPFDRFPTPRCWVHIPPGGGRRLTGRTWRVRAAAHVAEAETIEQAAGQIGPDSDRTVLVVDRPTPDDAAVLRRMTSDSIMVLAPFAMPEALEVQEENNQRARWTAFEWRTQPTWRIDFVRWIAARLDGAAGQVEPDAFVTWLRRIDPDERILSTPGHLVALLRLASRKDDFREMDLAGAAEDVVQFFAEVAEVVSDSQRDWLREHAIDVLDALVSEKLWLVDVPLDEGLPRAQWAKFVPPRFVAWADHKDARFEELLARPQPSGNAEREQWKDELREAHYGPDGEKAIRLLEKAGLLRQGSGDRLVVFPLWVETWWARRHVQEAVEADVPEKWGMLALDRARRELLDEVLAELQTDAVIDLIARLLDTPDASLGSVAAAESLFLAVGQLLLDGWQPDAGDQELLFGLWDRVRPHLVHRYDAKQAPLAPLTRPGLGDWGDESIRWGAATWAWSIRLGAPESIEGVEAWLFPGWSPLRLEDAELVVERLGLPSSLRELDPTDRKHRPEWAFSRVPALVPEVAARAEADELPERVPDLLVAEVIVRGPARGWKLPRDVVDTLTVPWVREMLDQRLSTMTREEQTTVSEHLLLALGTMRGLRPEAEAVVLELAECHARQPIIERLLEGGRWGPKELATTLLRWPVRLQLVTAKWLAEREPTAFRRIVSDLDKLGQPHREFIKIIADALPGDWQAVQALWRVDPEAALRRTVERLHNEIRGSTGNHARAWFGSAPPTHIGHLVDQLEQVDPERLPSWVEGWLARRVLQVRGQLAKDVFDLRERVRARRE